MAGTGLPTGDNRPVLLQPSPLVASDNSAADMWGKVADGAGRLSSSFMSVADEIDKQKVLADSARYEADVTGSRAELHAKFRDDPDGFKGGWQAYSDDLLARVEPRYVDLVRKKLATEGASTLGSIYDAWASKNRALNADSVKTFLTTAETNILGAAYRGETATPQFQDAVKSFQHYADAGAQTGLWSTDRASAMVKDMMTRANAEGVVGNAKAAFDRLGVEGAFVETDKTLKGMNLSPQDVERYRGRVAAEISKWQGFRSADLQQTQQRAALVEDKFKLGTATEDEARATAATLAALGDRRGAAKVMRGFATQEQLAADAWLSPTATAASIADQRQRVRPYAEKVVGSENATGNPAAQNPNSSATGDGQFIKSTWLDLVKRNAPDVAAGKSDADILALRADPKLSRRMIQAYGDENRAELAAAGLPAGDGEAYLAHFAGLGGAKAVLLADPSTPLRDILTPDAIAANAGMKAGGKAFADWTAGDLRGWAAGKMGDAGDAETVLAREAANRKKEAALREDPLSYISSIRGGPQLPVLDWSKPDAAATALTERQRISRAASGAFGVGPAPALTKPELDQLKATWTSADSGTRAQIVGTLSRSLDGDTRTATLEKIAGDNPVFAAAGMLYGQNPDLAVSVVRGTSYIDADKKILPPEKDIRQEINDYLGSAVASMPKSRDAIVQAATARYADLSAAAKDFSGTYDSGRMRRALQDVSGGVVAWGQGTRLFGFAGVPKVIPPKPGMDDAAFGKMMDGLTDADLAGATTGGGSPIKASEFHRLASLHDAGPGRYLVEIGGGVALGPDKKPFVLDLNGRAQ
jgi:hypothetical protein